MVPPNRVRDAYALESLLQQAFFLSGPLLVAAFVLVSGPELALSCSAGMTLVGTLAFVVAAVSTPSKTGPSRGGALRVRTIRILVATSLLQSVAFGAQPVGLVALCAQVGRPGMAGALQALLTAGGLIGTFIAIHGSYSRLLAAHGILLLPIAAFTLISGPPALIGVGAATLAAGLLLTPIAAVSYLLVNGATRPANRTEAFAWLSTGLAIGNAAGAAVSGVLVDQADPAVALAAGPVAVALAALVSRSLVASTE